MWYSKRLARLTIVLGCVCWGPWSTEGQEPPAVGRMRANLQGVTSLRVSSKFLSLTPVPEQLPDVRYRPDGRAVLARMEQIWEPATDRSRFHLEWTDLTGSAPKRTAMIGSYDGGCFHYDDFSPGFNVPRKLVTSNQLPRLCPSLADLLGYHLADGSDQPLWVFLEGAQPGRASVPAADPRHGCLPFVANYRTGLPGLAPSTDELCRIEVWLDPRQGHLPISIREERGGNDRRVKEIRITEAREIQPGFWLPLRGIYRVSSLTDRRMDPVIHRPDEQAAMPRQSQWRDELAGEIVIDPDRLKLNIPIHAGTFELAVAIDP